MGNYTIEARQLELLPPVGWVAGHMYFKGRP